jgi:hypothetical protein
MNMLSVCMHIMPEGMIMAATTIRHKHMRLDQTKLHRVKAILGVATETEALEEAMNLVLAEDAILRVLRRVRGKGRIERVYS